MYRYADESDYSMADSVDENVLEGGVTIQLQTEKRRASVSSSVPFIRQNSLCSDICIKLLYSLPAIIGLQFF